MCLQHPVTALSLTLAASTLHKLHVKRNQVVYTKPSMKLSLDLVIPPVVVDLVVVLSRVSLSLKMPANRKMAVNGMSKTTVIAPTGAFV